MNDIQIFDNPKFGTIRTVEINGETWFVGKDVADALGYSNPRKALADHVDVEDKNTVTIRDGTSGNPNMTVINESGLYALILSSKLPTAREFKHWVTSEILPTIRKQGSYALSDDLTHLELPEQDGEIIQHRQLTLTEGIRIANLISSCSNDRLPLLLDTLELYGIALPEAEKLRKQIRAKSKGTDEDKEELSKVIYDFLDEHPDYTIDDLVDRLRRNGVSACRVQLAQYKSKRFYPPTVGEADEIIKIINDFSTEIYLKQASCMC